MSVPLANAVWFVQGRLERFNKADSLTSNQIELINDTHFAVKTVMNLRDHYDTLLELCLTFCRVFCQCFHLIFAACD